MNTRVPEGHELHRLELAVSGLPQGPAAAPTAARLRGVAGVCELIGNPVTERAVVLLDPAVIGIDDIVQVFKGEGLGLEGTVARWHLRVAGLACDRCARRIEEAVTKLPGVTAAFVNRATESLTVELVVGQTDIEGVRTSWFKDSIRARPRGRE